MGGWDARIACSGGEIVGGMVRYDTLLVGETSSPPKLCVRRVSEYTPCYRLPQAEK